MSNSKCLHSLLKNPLVDISRPNAGDAKSQDKNAVYSTAARLHLPPNITEPPDRRPRRSPNCSSLVPLIFCLRLCTQQFLRFFIFFRCKLEMKTTCGTRSYVVSHMAVSNWSGYCYRDLIGRKDAELLVELGHVITGYIASGSDRVGSTILDLLINVLTGSLVIVVGPL